MRDETVARTYAETAFSLAREHEGLEAFTRGMEAVVQMTVEHPDFKRFLETPRIAATEKKALVQKVFAPHLPKMLLNFLLIVIDKRRQRLLGEIARIFHSLVDEFEGRVHVEVSVARPMDEATLEALGARLSAMLNKTAVPKVRVKPDLVGGVVIRAGDTMYDGSLKRRLSGMRRRMLAADLSGGEA